MRIGFLAWVAFEGDAFDFMAADLDGLVFNLEAVLEGERFCTAELEGIALVFLDFF